MNDNELSQLMKNNPVASDDIRDEHIESALQHFPSSSSRRSSRNTLWSVAAAALLVVGVGIGVSVQNLTDNNNEIYAEADIGALGAVSADASSADTNVTKGLTPIGPCDNEYSGAQFVAIVLVDTERVAVYATGTSSEPIVQLVDPQSCDELAISRR
jgi:hypothetical protein